MPKYMALFQIGPVQEFIRAARKTQDYWASSFLLSYLNCHAIDAFGSGDVVFPQVKGRISSSFFGNALQNKKFWKSVTDPALYIPSVPNRFFGMVNDPPRKKLEKAKDAVLKKWQAMAADVLNYITTEAKSISIDQTFWDDQIKQRALEILYIWREWQDNEDYGLAYQKTEALMGARKMSRIFPHLNPQDGYACSLCGLRVALGSSQVKTRQQLRDWWQEHLRHKSLTYRFREGEYLCAVCTVKRLYPGVVFSRAADVPSTSTMATITWQRELQGLFAPSVLQIGDQQQLQVKMQVFKDAVQNAANSLGEPKTASLPAYFAKIPRDQKLEMEGDWLLDSWYQHKDRREKVQKALNCLKELKKTIAELVKKTKAAPSGTTLQLNQPAKYLALMAADGDSMGEYLAGCNEKQHQGISEKLQTFATQAVPQVLEKDRPGFILYWGGDEGLALVSLADLLPALQALQAQWRKVVLQNEQRPTLSVGTVIFHHQYPLRMAIQEVYQTLEYAKEMRSYNRQKDAWAVKILKRSGAPLLTRAHWDYPINSQRLLPLAVLEEFLKSYQGDNLSPRWLAELAAEEKALGDPPANWSKSNKSTWCSKAQKLFDQEIKRLLNRHRAEGWDPKSLVEEVQRLNRAISGIAPLWNFARHQDLKGMLHLSHYIAKGGGR